MRFVDLHLDGFGKLVDCTFSFGPGLNLIFGPNEAGKSTLQHALLTLLYGFYEEGSVTKAKRDAAKVLAPWEIGVDFSGRLTYQLDDGQAFRVIRSFSGQPVTRLETAPDNQDSSSTYRSASHGRLFFADEQLGMSKAVFENTCVMRQAELIALEQSARAITDTLMRLSASASLDTTTSDALGLLDKALRDEIGSDRAWTKPLAQARKRLEDLQAAQQRTSEARREAFALISELNQEQGKLETLDSEIERLDCLATLAEQQSIQAQLDASGQADAEADRLAAEVERWKTWAEFPAHLRDQVIRLDAQHSRLEQELADQAPRVAEVRRQRAELARQITKAESKAAAVADARDVPVERLPAMQKLAMQWDSAWSAEQAAKGRLSQAKEHMTQLRQSLSQQRAWMGGIAKLGPVGLAQLQERWRSARQETEEARLRLRRGWSAWNRVGVTDEQFNAMAEITRQFQSGTYKEKRSKTGCNPLGRSKQSQGPPPEVVTYIQIKPIREQWEAAQVESQAVKKRLDVLEDQVRQRLGLEPGSPIDPEAFEAASRRLTDFTRRSSEVGLQRQAVAVAESDVQSARSVTGLAGQALGQALDTLGYTEPNPRAAMQSFEKACQRKAQWDQAASELERLRTEERVLAQEDQAQTRREEALQTVDQSLRTTLSEAGIAVVGDDLEGAVSEFEEQHRSHEKWLRAQDSYHAAIARPASGLTQEARKAAHQRLADLQRELEGWDAAHPEWAGLEADHDAHEYRERGRGLVDSLQVKRKRCTQLQESLQRITEGLSHPAELAEQIATAEAQVRRLEWLRDVLTLARDELEAATQEYQRAFAPRLEKLLADGLERATQGRYAQVGVDPSTLAVTLVAPERDEPVEAAWLSTGTRDLVYLLLRIGVARLMSRTGETLPLLLDDPLVQLDRSRREQTLHLLSSLAEETQIILFTKDDEIMGWFREQLAVDERHRVQTLD